MNVLTLDIEECYLKKMYLGNHAEEYSEFDHFLEEILNTLDRQTFKATFFCVGGNGHRVSGCISTSVTSILSCQT